jgi:glutamate synthase domain-containing protein 1
MPNGLPAPQGLYHPSHEHDACGLGFVANIDGRKSHDVVLKGIEVLINLTHRGACGCDPETGDGAGILIQTPHAFFAREAERLGFALPEPGSYGVGMVFFPRNDEQRERCRKAMNRVIREEGFEVLGWRDTPIDANAIGQVARASRPYIEQVFIAAAVSPASAADGSSAEDVLERKLYVIRKRTEAEITALDIALMQSFYIASLPGPPALFHQHLSHLAAGSSLSLYRAQRRNQHPERQRQLDVCPPIAFEFSAFWRRYGEAFSDHLARRQRLGEFR